MQLFCPICGKITVHIHIGQLFTSKELIEIEAYRCVECGFETGVGWNPINNNGSYSIVL